MTNQPLTAEAMAKKWIHALYNKYLTVEELQRAFEAYATQQNAELVAENEHLNRLLSRMSWYANIPAASGIDEVDDKREKEWDEFQNALDKLKKGRLLFEVEAENERLKQQLADLVASDCPI